MTLLNFHISDDLILMMSDTIVSTSDNGPCFFTSKVHWLPHLDGLICGTGSLNFILAWIDRVQSGMLARDLWHLNDYVTEALLDLADLMPPIFVNETTTTIYHLGYDKAGRKFGGFAYRSTDNFISEILSAGTRTKPGITIFPEGETLWPDYFIEIAKLQKADDDALPLAERVGIGGHLVSHTLTVDRTNESDSVCCNITKVHEFDDYQSMYENCVTNLPESL